MHLKDSWNLCLSTLFHSGTFYKWNLPVTSRPSDTPESGELGNVLPTNDREIWNKPTGIFLYVLTNLWDITLFMFHESAHICET